MTYRIPHTTGLTRDERKAQGKAKRQNVPRESHGKWQPQSERPDPLALLQAQDEGRLKHLLPIKYGRMLESPFAFLRGSAVVMASDLAQTPVSGINTIICGDAHLSNFGLFASPERELVFDVNDFDETCFGPWEWDLKRLVASAVVSGRENGLKDKANRDVAEGVVEVYRKTMRRLSEKRTMDVWYFHVKAENLEDVFKQHASKKSQKTTDKVFAKARSRTQEQTLDKLTYFDDGQRRIKSDPPLLVPLRAENFDQFVGVKNSDEMSVTAVEQTWQGYLSSLAVEKRFLLTRYQIKDVALRVGGVGSVGTRCLIVLLAGGADDDALILQMKEAGPSALAAYLPTDSAQGHAERIVTGQQLMQATTDIFLGWHTSTTSNRDFYWRQLKDMKGSIDVTQLDESGFRAYLAVCAICLARAHARTGDAAAISGYLGKSDCFDEAVADFALAYANQTEQDYKLLKEAVKSGRIIAEKGV